MPVYVERSILELEKLYINGESCYSVGISPTDLVALLSPTPVDAVTK